MHKTFVGNWGSNDVSIIDPADGRRGSGVRRRSTRLPGDATASASPVLTGSAASARAPRGSRRSSRSSTGSTTIRPGVGRRSTEGAGTPSVRWRSDALGAARRRTAHDRGRRDGPGDGRLEQLGPGRPVAPVPLSARRRRTRSPSALLLRRPPVDERRGLTGLAGRGCRVVPHAAGGHADARARRRRSMPGTRRPSPAYTSPLAAPVGAHTLCVPVRG